METITSILFQKHLEIGAGQRLLTLGVAPELVVEWAGRIGAGGEIWAIWDDLPSVQAAERLAREGRLKAGFHALHAADLADLPAQEVDACMVDAERYPSRVALLHLLWQAAGWLAPAAPLYLAGAIDGGIQSLERLLRARWGGVNVLAYKKGHRLLEAHLPAPAGQETDATAPAPAGQETDATAPAPAGQETGATAPAPSGETQGGQAHPLAPLEEQAVMEHSLDLRGQRFTLILRPGVFASSGLDPATRLLGEAFEVGQSGTILDLGCGSGVLGMLAARLAPGSQVYLVDSSAAALRTAQENCARNGLGNTHVLASDGVAAVRQLRFDLILCNPPFHQGRSHSSTLALRFMREASAALAPGGRFYLVANLFLRYEPAMRQVFGTVAQVAEDTKYKVLLAVAGG